MLSVYYISVKYFMLSVFMLIVKYFTLIHAIHEGHKDYKCKSCGKSFSYSGDFKRHITQFMKASKSVFMLSIKYFPKLVINHLKKLITACSAIIDLFILSKKLKVHLIEELRSLFEVYA